jgi:HD-like signal output (HDOD) protein
MVIAQKASDTGSMFSEIETEMLGYNHCEVGGLIARKWKLPKNLEIVIEYHHAENLPAFEDKSYEALCEIVRVADAIALSLSIGLKGPENIKVPYDTLGLSEANYATILDRFKTTYAEQKAALTS